MLLNRLNQNTLFLSANYGVFINSVSYSRDTYLYMQKHSDIAGGKLLKLKTSSHQLPFTHPCFKYFHSKVC